MATAEQLKALLHSYATADQERFLSVAMQIAATAARSGKQKLADDLRDLVDEAKRRHPNRTGATDDQPLPLVRPSGELAGLVVASCPQTRLASMVLPPPTLASLRRVVTEYKQAAVLSAHGLRPRRKVLLIGPPGTGKTMTAAALAGELHLPLLQVQLHGLITKYMGETAAKLHVVFEAMHTTRGVYLFDEFDAIGAMRNAGNDVGEVRRVLNSFLTFLEQDGSESLLVAATNLSSMLDSALLRRFDDVVRYSLPSDDMVRQLVANRLALFGTRGVCWDSVSEAARGLSQADVVRACEDAAKDAVLAGGSDIGTDGLLAALAERQVARVELMGEPGGDGDGGSRASVD